jgi:hypothetical protein
VVLEFMAGVSSTARLKFNHRFLSTTTHSDGGALLAKAEV